MAFGQKTVYTITKKDGTVYEAKSYSSLHRKDLKLKKINGEKVRFPYHELDKIEYVETDKWNLLKNGNEDILLKFVKISDRNGKLMMVVVEGYCNLYLNHSYGSANDTSDAFVKRFDEEIATVLFKVQAIRKSFKSNASDYFKDCPKAINGIKSKKFNKKNIKELVVFYNANCN